MSKKFAFTNDNDNRVVVDPSLTKKSNKIAKKMIDAAKAHDKQVTNDLLNITKGTAATISYDQKDDEGIVRNSLTYRIKTQDSLSDKLRKDSKYDESKLESTAKEVYDVLRYTALVDDPDMLVKSFHSIKLNLEQQGYTMMRCRNTLDTYNNENPYRGINTVIQTKDRYNFELQFHTTESLRIKEKNHALYKQVSDKNSDKQNQKLLDEMYKNSKAMKNIKNSSSISSFDKFKKGGK